MSRLLLFFCAALFIAATVKSGPVPVELAEMGKVARDICLKETGVDEKKIDEAILGNFDDDPKLKCYYKCLLDQFGVIENDEINFDMLLALVPKSIEEAGVAAVNNCRNEGGTDLCDKADKLERCFYKQNPELFFIP